jgi:hypothetical protein
LTGTQTRNLRLDVGGWYEKQSPKVRRLVAKRIAFRTDKSIAPQDLSLIDQNLYIEVKRYADELHLMAKLLPFQYSPEDERRILAERQRSLASFEPTAKD